MIEIGLFPEKGGAAIENFRVISEWSGDSVDAIDGTVQLNPEPGETFVIKAKGYEDIRFNSDIYEGLGLSYIAAKRKGNYLGYMILGIAFFIIWKKR